MWYGGVGVLSGPLFSFWYGWLSVGGSFCRRGVGGCELGVLLVVCGFGVCGFIVCGFYCLVLGLGGIGVVVLGCVCGGCVFIVFCCCFFVCLFFCGVGLSLVQYGVYRW